ncbi:MAG: ATP synthase F0 subunit C [Candidatus Tectomicrobia bacterium]|nr:ATP synthase F0 subunit C [Candidatus Tectomicrobia bacterium]
MAKTWLVSTLSALLLTFVVVPAALAQGAGESGKISYFIWAAIVSGGALALAAMAGAFGQSRGLSAALDGISRNPSASGQLTTTLIIGLALIESLVIYVLVVSLILLFVDPFKMLAG